MWECKWNLGSFLSQLHCFPNSFPVDLFWTTFVFPHCYRRWETQREKRHLGHKKCVCFSFFFSLLLKGILSFLPIFLFPPSGRGRRRGKIPLRKRTFNSPTFIYTSSSIERELKKKGHTESKKEKCPHPHLPFASKEAPAPHPHPDPSIWGTVLRNNKFLSRRV